MLRPAQRSAVPDSDRHQHASENGEPLSRISCAESKWAGQSQVPAHRQHATLRKKKNSLAAASDSTRSSLAVLRCVQIRQLKVLIAENATKIKRGRRP